MLLLSETFWFSLDSVSLTFICVAGYSCSLYFSHCCIIVHFVSKKAKTKVKVLFVQLCLNLCDPVDFSSLGSYIRGTFQVGSLEWVTIPFSRDLPDPGIEPGWPALQAHSLLSELPGKPQLHLTYSPIEKYLILLTVYSCEQILLYLHIRVCFFRIYTIIVNAESKDMYMFTLTKCLCLWFYSE